MRLCTAAFVAAVTSSIVISGVGAGQQSSGLAGKVLRGPVTPVCIVTRPCQVPASATLAFRQTGREVARVRSTKTGEYRISLPPGRYAVRPAFHHPLWRISPQAVRVPSGGYARVNFLIDTGIR